MPKMWEPAKVHSDVGEWERCKTRERVPEILAHGGLCQVRGSQTFV